MFKSKFYTLTLALFFCRSIFAQEKDIRIPFQLTEFNNISVSAVLNSRDTVNLMLHTAASSVTLTEDAAKRIKSLTFNSTIDGVKSWGGESNAARLSENNTLQMGELQWNNVSIWENKYSGQKTDGKFGIDLFKDKVVILDFDRKLLTIATTLPPKIKKYEKLKLLFEDEQMFLEVKCRIGDSYYKNSFLIHSGYSGGLLFDDNFTRKNDIDKKLRIVDEKELKDSYGNILKTKKAVLPTLLVGNKKLSSVPVEFFSGAIAGQKMSVMGGGILKKFNIVIDAKREYVYLWLNDFQQ
jgi:hypothetical protein